MHPCRPPVAQLLCKKSFEKFRGIFGRWQFFLFFPFFCLSGFRLGCWQYCPSLTSPYFLTGMRT